MADVRRTSYLETDRAQKVLVQTGRVVQEAEFNEAEDILRVMLYRNLTLALGASGVRSGLTVTGGVNAVTVAAGEFEDGGYRVKTTAGTTVTGLTTPGGARTDYLYAALAETEVIDPHPHPDLGATSYRRKLTVTFLVVEGGAVPANTGNGELWMGDLRYFTIARLSRTASDTINAGMIELIFNALPPWFDDGVSGDVVVRRLRSPAGSPALPASVLRSLNARAELTLGNGVTTFGDFNGGDAITRALAHAWAYLPAASSVTLRLKAGTYTAGPGQLVTLSGPVRFVGSGPEAGDCVITNNHASDIPTVTAGPFAVEFEDLSLFGTATAWRAVSGERATFRRCGVGGTVDWSGSLQFGVCVVEASSWLPQSGREALRMRPTVGTSSAVPAVHRCRVTVTGAAPVVRAVGLVSHVYDGLSVTACELTLGVATSRTAGAGLLLLADSAAVVDLASVVFERCAVRGVGAGSYALRLRVGYSSADDAATTGSRVQSFVMRDCTFYQTGSLRTLGAGFFRFEQRAFAGAGAGEANNTGSVTLENCVFDLGGFTQGLDAGSAANDKAAVVVAATHIRVANLRVRNVVNKLYLAADAAPTRYSAIVALVPTYKEQANAGYELATCDVDGAAFEMFTTSGVGADVQPYYGLYVGTTDSLFVATVRRLVWASLTAGGVTAAMTFVATVELGGRGEGTIEASKVLTDYEPIGIHVSSGRKTIRDCHVEGTVGDGIAGSVANVDDVVLVQACRAIDCGAAGIGVGGTDGSVHVDGCYAVDNGDIGIVVTGTHQRVTNCTAVGNNGAGAGADQIDFPSSDAADTRVATGNRCESSPGTRGSIRSTGSAPAATRFTGFDTADANTLGTFTDGAAMRFNDALLNKT